MRIDSGQPITTQIHPGIYFVTNYHESKMLMAEQGYYLRIIESRAMLNEQIFFEMIKREFNFPDYFGENWNAFGDCLADFGLNRDLGEHSIPYIVYVDQVNDLNLSILSEMIYEINVVRQEYYIDNAYIKNNYYVYIFVEELLHSDSVFVEKVLYNPHPANWRDMDEGDFSIDPRWKVYQIPEHPIIITVV